MLNLDPTLWSSSISIFPGKINIPISDINILVNSQEVNSIFKDLGWGETVAHTYIYIQFSQETKNSKT